MASLSSSSRLGINSRFIVVTPVKLPPGRARLRTTPISMGSLTAAKTTGSCVPVCLTARTAGVFTAKITSNWS